MVFEHILWMFVCLRLLGAEPLTPSPGDSLVQYAADLELQCCRLRLDYARSPTVDEEQIVRLSKTAPKRKLSNGDSPPGVNVGVGAILHEPSGLLQQVIDCLPGKLFRRQ